MQCDDEGVGYLMVTQKVRTRSIEVLGPIGTCLLYMCIHECLCTAVRLFSLLYQLRKISGSKRPGH